MAFETPRASLLRSGSLAARCVPEQEQVDEFFECRVLGKDRAERCLLDTHVSWTAVYPVSLRNGKTSATVTVKPLDEVGSVPGLPVISYADVARVLLELAGDRARAGQRLLITTANGWSAEPRSV
ncbi:NAD(P)H-binding protein [Cystobacter ferrugineus]|uniref:Uncharacterized protein n=1 Tax=Cystobacter ferrugineus TaxID=83449 RepID=A0A1L9BJT3_9BACT|nr:NAD(P)H-binding protein [Cystobacter ferrugineus]OJH42503.1 hypothetical protein BON30_04735 [Cystobacter ferrugineus]